MSKTKLWDVSELTFKIIFSNPLILHTKGKCSQKRLSDLSKAIQLINGTERMRIQLSLLLAQKIFFLHYTRLHCSKL